MKTEGIVNFGDVLENIDDYSPLAWIYLPNDEAWGLFSKSAVLESNEVPPEQEDDPEAGIPDIAMINNMIQVLPVTVLQDIVSNARAQNAHVNLVDLFKAFEYFRKHDAFIDFTDTNSHRY
jgi:hypothetical protein